MQTTTPKNLKCPHCSADLSDELEILVGLWEDLSSATTSDCPECGKNISYNLLITVKKA